MVSRIMTAYEAYLEFRSKWPSIISRGNVVILLNSVGKPMEVGKNDRVYHRGRGRFALYSQARDAKHRGQVRKGMKRDPRNIGYGKFRNMYDDMPRKGR